VDFAASIEFDAPVTTVAEMFATEAYVRDKIAASGALDGSVEILGDVGGAFTVTTRRTMPTTEIPAAYRSLVGSSLEVRQVEAWEVPAADGSRRGTLSLEVTGAPVRVTGSLVLGPAPGGRSVESFSGEIKASVPFVGKTIEKAVAGNVHHVVAVERAAAERWLAGRR
jgi:hypothetical protein